MIDRTLTLHGQRLHYLDAGNPAAPPVIMLHGITGHARTWETEARALADRYRVVALDQRGHGDSDPVPDGDYTVAAMAEDLAAFADALNLRRVSLVGLSMGGRVAIAYAGRHPTRVERLMVIDIGPDVAPAGRIRVGNLMAQSPERFETIDAAIAYVRTANPRYRDALLRERVRHGVHVFPDGSVRWKYDGAIREAVRTGRWRDSTDLWTPWKAIACPTLIVRGAESDILSPEIAKQMLEALPHARVIEVPGAGHTVPGDQPEAFLALLSEFLST